MEPSEALNQLVLIVGQTKNKSRSIAKRDRRSHYSAKVLFRVIEDVLRWLRYEGNPTNVLYFKDDDDMLTIATFHYTPGNVVSGLKLIFDAMLNCIGFSLVQFLPNQSLEISANRRAQLGFLITLDLNALHRITRIDISFSDGLCAALLEEKHDSHTIGLIACKKSGCYSELGLVSLNARSHIIG